MNGIGALHGVVGIKGNSPDNVDAACSVSVDRYFEFHFDWKRQLYASCAVQHNGGTVEIKPDIANP